MIADLSILVRFNPENLFLPQQYLCLSPAGDWLWLSKEEMPADLEPHQFPTHAAACKAAPDHAAPATWNEGKLALPWALVCGNPLLEAERDRRRQNRDLTLEASTRSTLDPAEIYRETSRRLGEHEPKE